MADAVTGAHRLDDGVPIDLAAPRDDLWSVVEVPAGWDAVAAVARAVAGELDHLADAIVEDIHDEIATYRRGTVPTEDLHASVVSNLRMMLVGVAEHRPPTAHEITVRRELGVRRALQGAPVDALIQAFHIGYRELWRALVRALPDDDPDASTQLLSAATTVWGWVHEITQALTAAHAATVRRLEARVVGARQRFVELLVSGDLDGEEADRLGRSLGFDPTGGFLVVALAGAADDHDAVELQRRVEGLPGRHAVAARGPLVVVVTQDADPVAAIGNARAVIPSATVAVGSLRPGLAGARASLADAELALEVTEEGATSTFEDVWLWATLGDVEGRLRVVLRGGTEVAAAHPHLAEAVTAYADHGFSVSEAARQLSLHANTVGYRLDRWAELTGWDPRTFAGLVRSVAAIRLG